VFDKVVPGKTASYIRRDDYWGKDLPINKGRSNFDRLTVEFYTDTTAAFEGFKGGVYNFRAENYSKLWATAYNFPSLSKGWVVKKTLPDGNPSGTQGYWINARKEKFQDLRVRQAIGLMFNFEWSNETLFYGQYARTVSFWGNTPMQANGLPSAGELALLEPLAEYLPASTFNEEAFSPNISKTTKLDRAALRKAGKLLDEAGWKVINGKRTNAKGTVLSVNFLNDSPAFERITNPYIANLKRLGIDARLETVDAAQATERQKSFDYDIVIQRFSMSKTPGIELRRILSSSSVDTHGSDNLSGIMNPAIDALLEKIEQAETRKDLNTAVSALDRSLRALHIWVPQWYNATHRVAYLDIYEHPEKIPPYSLGQMDFWWYNADKAKKLQAEGAF
ncbi:MAG: extracellular solute-binding protein, partial [Amylibacter sp.]